MIEVGNVLVHEDLLNNDFVCNISKCKGICCIEGDSGAPLKESEKAILEEIYPKVKPYMTEKGIQAIEEQGKYVLDNDGDLTTTCVDGNNAALHEHIQPIRDTRQGAP